MEKKLKLNKTEYMVIDKVLFEANYPILFTCLDKHQELYICVCSQNNEKGKKWLLTKTTPRLVIEMLSDKIAIRDIFLKFPDFRISVMADEYGIQMKKNDENDWKDDSIYLPQADEYMEVEEGEFNEEIDYYKQMIENYYCNQIFQPQMQFKGIIDSQMEVLANMLGNDANQTIHGRVLIKTLDRTIQLSSQNWQSIKKHNIGITTSIKQRKVEMDDSMHTAKIDIESDNMTLNAA